MERFRGGRHRQPDGSFSMRCGGTSVAVDASQRGGPQVAIRRHRGYAGTVTMCGVIRTAAASASRIEAFREAAVAADVIFKTGDASLRGGRGVWPDGPRPFRAAAEAGGRSSGLSGGTLGRPQFAMWPDGSPLAPHSLGLRA